MKQVNSRRDGNSVFSGDVPVSPYFTFVKRTVNQNINSATDTILTFNVETTDTIPCFDLGVSTSQFIFPFECYINMNGIIIWSGGWTSPHNSMFVARINGAIESGEAIEATTGGVNTSNYAGGEFHVHANDVLDFQVWQDTGIVRPVILAEIFISVMYVP